MSTSITPFDLSKKKRKILLSERINTDSSVIQLFKDIQSVLGETSDKIDKLMESLEFDKGKYLQAMDSLQDAKNKFCESVLLEQA